MSLPKVPGWRSESVKDLAALVRSYERACIEMQRAENDETAWRAERLQKAGNRIWLARYRMFEAVKSLRAGGGEG
jgi:predicted trehalose synthase